MGLLDQLLQSATGGNPSATQQTATGDTGGLHTGLLNAVLGMAANQQTGGLNGLLGQLKAGGLESAVNSWVGNGANQQVTGSQIQNALGSSQIQQLAAQFGLPQDAVAGHLAQILPEVINHLTPQGNVPAPSLLQESIGLLKGKLMSQL